MPPAFGILPFIATPQLVPIGISFDYRVKGLRPETVLEPLLRFAVCARCRWLATDFWMEDIGSVCNCRQSSSAQRR